MCAINGFNWSDKGKLLEMNEVTHHRGPDDTGIFLNENISLGHNRLSIIDLSSDAHQPMQSNSGRFTISYNGELYNFKELKKQLESGYDFKSESDTEVILAAYEKWGKSCLERFNGIFTFAIWDNLDEEIFVARDFVGVKPLYYYWDGKRFIFSSEIKGILEHNIPRKLNKDSFEHFMRIQYIPEPLTMFQDIHKLPKAHYISLKADKFEMNEYWKISYGDYSQKSAPELKHMLKDCIESAVKRQLISDRPVGIFLSGGMDSSIVLDTVSKLKNKVQTYSVGFDLNENEDREKFNADFKIAKKTASIYGSDHHELMITTDDVINNLEKAMWHLDEPITSTTVIPQLKLSEYASENVAVVLGGDGGDELFGGYERYRLALASETYQRFIPRMLRKSVSGIGKLGSLNKDSGIDHFEMFMFQGDDVLNKVLKSEIGSLTKKTFANNYFRYKDISAPEMLMDVDRQSWLVNDSLLRSDKLSMASGLEARVPLLDKEVIELAYRIPLKYKIELFNTKVILKDAFKDSLPDYLFKQPKRGWFSPAAKWIRNPKVLSYLKQVLSDEFYSESRKLFDFNEIHEVLGDHVEGRKYNLTVIWTILAFQLWAKKFNVQIEN